MWNVCIKAFWGIQRTVNSDEALLKYFFFSDGRLETGSLTSIIEKTLAEEVDYPTAPHTTSPKKSKSLRKKAKKSTSISGKLFRIVEKIKGEFVVSSFLPVRNSIL